MNLILKALNDISIIIRNTISIFLPINDTKTSQDSTTLHNYPHNHTTTSTATKTSYKYIKTDPEKHVFPLSNKDFPHWNKDTKGNHPYPYDLYGKSPYSSIKLKDNLNKISIRTDNAILRLRKAVFNKGPNPKFHDKLMKKHRKEWPELWIAIDEILKDDKKNVNLN